MCKNTQNATNLHENHCDCKAICKKMRNAALLQASSILSSNTDTRIVTSVLYSIIDIVSSYPCLPCEIIKKRAQYTLDNISLGGGSLYSHELSKVTILSEEIKAFLDS